MQHVEVPGFDCPAYRKTFRLIEEAARELGVAIRLEKVDDPTRILGYRVLSVPGVAVGGKLVHSGGVPSRKLIASWLTAQQLPEGDAP